MPGVRPESVEVSGGTLSSRLPTRSQGVALFSVCSPSGTVDEVWLQGDWGSVFFGFSAVGAYVRRRAI